jgi:tetrathionate reductase subunit C
MEKYRPIAKTGVILATLLLIAAPLFLLIHVGKPLRAWHLFRWIQLTSPISYGSFFLTIYPINCIIYAYFIFKNNTRFARIFGLTGIPLAILVHGYTGVILSVVKAHPYWHSALMPVLFLVSAIVSGIAMMILVSIIQGKYFSAERQINMDMITGLASLLAWAIIIDIFLVVSEVIKLSLGDAGDLQTVALILMGPFAWSFLGVEIMIGKIIPFMIVINPSTRKPAWLTLASVMVMVGIFAMRCNVVLGGEFLPLI